MLEIVPSKQFKKDLKLAKKRGLQIDHLRNVINALAQQQKLADSYRDHNLTGEYRGFRECHIEPDRLIQMAPGAYISQGQAFYFSRPEKHPFSSRKSAQFFSKATISCGFIHYFSPKSTSGI